MVWIEQNPRMLKIYDMLQQFGVSADYSGFYYTAYAVYLSLEEPNRLFRITKEIYPDVAKHYKTCWATVERNIRTISQVVWQKNVSVLSQATGLQFTFRPRNSQFLAILVTYYRMKFEQD